jgi:hypothetical protein
MTQVGAVVPGTKVLPAAGGIASRNTVLLEQLHAAVPERAHFTRTTL